MNRRNFVRLVGGGVVVASAGAGLAGCAGAAYPAASVEAWNGPGAETDARRRAVAYAITAPNPHNRQPWLVDLREADAITLYCDRDRLLPETDPFGWQILIGHGAFLELLVLALAEQGVRADVTIWPQGELPAQLKDWDRRPVARLNLSRGAQPDPLFAQTLRRHTPKSDFDPARPVSAAVLQALQDSAGDRAVRAGGTIDAAQLPALRELCWQSAKVELLTPRTMMESVRLMRIGPDEILKHRDGITLNSPFVRLATAAGLFDRSAPPVEGSAGYKNAMSRFEGHSRTAMGFVWLSTAGNSRSQQVQAGRAYVRMQLKATELGVGVHPMSQALQEFAEMKPWYEKAHELTLGMAAPRQVADTTLQMFCRLGYAPEPTPATPRRAIGDLYLT